MAKQVTKVAEKNNTKQLFWKKFCCGLCLAELPMQLRSDGGRVYQLVTHERPIKNFLMLESMFRVKHVSRTLTQFEAKDGGQETIFKVGRGS